MNTTREFPAILSILRTQENMDSVQRHFDIPPTVCPTWLNKTGKYWTILSGDIVVTADHPELLDLNIHMNSDLIAAFPSQISQDGLRIMFVEWGCITVAYVLDESRYVDFRSLMDSH